MNSAQRLAHVDGMNVDTCGPGEIAAALGHVRALRGHLDAREAELARRQQVLAETSGAAPAVDALNRFNKSTRAAAKRAAARAETLGDAPSMNRLLDRGVITGEHADALSAEAGRLDDDRRAALLGDEASLASVATTTTPEQFRRYVKKTVQQQSDDDGIDESERQREAARVVLGVNESTGMGEIRGELHPDDWQQVNRRIDAEVAALRRLDEHSGKDRAQLSAVALVGLVCGARSESTVPARVVVHVDFDAIDGVDGAPRFGEYSDSRPVPVETTRRHACDAEILPVVLSGDGLPLDVGRAQRLATKAQRLALRSMYRTCAIDGCSTNFDRCEIHHSLEWTAHRGPTDLEHLMPLCSYHHHRAHEGRWRLCLDADTRQLDVFLPDGTLYASSVPDILGEPRPPDRRAA